MLLSTLIGLYIYAIQADFSSQPPNAVTVFAGNDTYTCQNQNITLSSLNATISGDGVSNGDWITLGDGRFMPSNTTSARFSSAVTYIPGSNDRVLGWYKLLLIADPSSMNPNERVQDDVRVTFKSAPPLACSNNISISLDENCQQKVDVALLIPNPQIPFSQYIITLYDAAGVLIPNNTLTKAHINQLISYKLGHDCSSNTCWGKLTVKDYFPPILKCNNDTISCLRSIVPDSLGWPFPTTAYIDTIINGNFIVKNWDKCSDVTLNYTDELIISNCLQDIDRRIKRIWTASDAYGNSGFCEEWIVIKRTTLAQIVFPGHFDGIVYPIFECQDSFPKLANGHPSPDTTGRPFIGSCKHLQFSMTDIPFELCGESFKVVRSWFVIDWCTSESVTKNQFIYIMDRVGPVLDCQDTIFIGTSAYDCFTPKLAIDDPIVLFDCNTTSYNIDLATANGNYANNYISKVGSRYFVDKLPIGSYSVNYTVTDACNNTNICRTTLIVQDKIAPYIACDQTTKVSVSELGVGIIFAQTFDDSSFDNCGIERHRVRRMTTACGLIPAWSDKAIFCCEDIGTIQRVSLEITDIHGNSNTCMVEVIVEDKLVPTITCPPDLTIECDQSYDYNDLKEYGSVRTNIAEVNDVNINNYYHNGLVGKDGLAKDNCQVTVNSTVLSDVKCFGGKLTRTFVAKDQAGNTATCNQIITIKNPDPFDEFDITWPQTYGGSGCRVADLLPDVTGKPIFRNTTCATVSANYEDQMFYIADGACIKIIRTWTVIDWCQYNAIGDPGKFGPFVQVIKIHNTDAPVFTRPCIDTTFCSYDVQCNGTRVTLEPIAEDICTATELLEWSYKLDIDNNGTTDSIAQKYGYDGQLPLGVHKITFAVEDQCGNFATCSQIITVKDCKNPTPYCHGSLSVTLDEINGFATIWAIDYNKGATDNCTKADELIFTFDKATPNKTKINQRHFFKNQGILSDSASYVAGSAQVWVPSARSSGLYFDCDDLPNGIIGNITIVVSVTDLVGNQDNCEVDLVLDDHHDLCIDVLSEADISGRAVTSAGLVVHDVKIGLQTTEHFMDTSVDTLDGSYIFNDVRLDQPYSISASKTTGLLDGVSTLDLVKIQRHILNLARFDSPYKLIAADVNQSKSISASDLVDLRKLILGIKNKFPQDADPWAFVPSSYAFADNNIPFYYQKTIEIGSIQNDMIDQNFIAIKLGDVNDSADGHDFQNKTDYRTANYTALSFKLVMSDDNVNLEIYGDQNAYLSGIQLYLGLQNVDIEDVTSRYFDQIDFNYKNDSLAIVAVNRKDIYYDQVLPLMILKLANLPSPSYFLTLMPKSELYVDEKIVSISSINKMDLSDRTLFKIINNPASDVLKISFQDGVNLAGFSYDIIDVLGRIIVNSSDLKGIQNSNELHIDLSNVVSNSVHHIRFWRSGALFQGLPFIPIN
jgi:hypothetical protein